MKLIRPDRKYIQSYIEANEEDEFLDRMQKGVLETMKQL